MLKKLLIIEDDQEAVSLLKGIIDTYFSSQLVVYTAGSKEVAHGTLAEPHIFSIIICDFNLGQGSEEGRQIYEEFIDPTFSKFGISEDNKAYEPFWIFISGSDSVYDKISVKTNTTFLGKPLSENDIVNKVTFGIDALMDASSFKKINRRIDNLEDELEIISSSVFALKEQISKLNDTVSVVSMKASLPENNVTKKDLEELRELVLKRCETWGEKFKRYFKLASENKIISGLITGLLMLFAGRYINHLINLWTAGKTK